MTGIDLSGQIALVTGGTRGIGAAICQKLQEAGAKIFATGKNIEAINKLNKKADNNINYIYGDFTNREGIRNFISRLERLDKIDICINNAGINIISEFTDVSEDDYDMMQNINLKAPYHICQAVCRKMKDKEYGRIVNISSIWGCITRPKRSAYSTSKFGVLGMTKTIAVEYGEYGILANTLSPGFTLTELTKNTNTAEEIEKISNDIPMKRMARPEEIANIALFLTSPLNTYLTGQNIIVDGGFTSV